MMIIMQEIRVFFGTKRQTKPNKDFHSKTKKYGKLYS